MMENYQRYQALLQAILDKFCKGNKAELARLLGKNPTYINRLFYSPEKNGTKGIGLEIMKACSSAFPLPLGFWDMEPVEDLLDTYKNISLQIDDDVSINQYDAGGSMGGGRLTLEDQPGLIKSWKVDREWVRMNVKHHTSVENLCIVTGFGDSMMGMYNPGDPLLVDKGVTTCEFDGVYFFRVGHEGFIKRLQRIPGQGVLVISENTKYRDWTITPEMDFQVFAKVLKVWQSQSL